MSNQQHFLPDDSDAQMAERFRGFLPVVIDVETGGFDAQNNALLEIAAVTLAMNDEGQIIIADSLVHNVKPHPDTHCEQAALEFNGIDPDDPGREARRESDVLHDIFQLVRRSIKDNNCNRAVMVAHNAHFDLGFVNAAVMRNDIKRNPFHPFSCFDTATLGGLAFGQTVLAKACKAAGIPFNNAKAHSALYDAKRTALLFCNIVNRWQALGGWQAPEFN